MNRNEKIQLVNNLSKKIKETDHYYIADTSGLAVKEINMFRKMCFDQGVEYKLIKNTLIRRALKSVGTDDDSLKEVLKGSSGIMFVNENANVPAKIIKKFRKEHNQEKPRLKAACIESELFIGNDQLEPLANLKSRQELIGGIIILLQSPAKNVLSLLQSGEQKLAGIIKVLSERKD